MPKIKHITFVILLVLQFHSDVVHGQLTKMDSLINELRQAKEDTDKVNILYSLSDLSVKDADVMEYARKALQLAEKLNYQKGIADACNNIGYVYNQKGEIDSASEYYQKSLKIKERIRDKNDIAPLLNNIAAVYERQGAISLALENYQKSLRIREEIRDSSGIAKVLNNIGLLYKSQKDFLHAYEYIQKSLAISQKINDKDGIARAFVNIGFIFQGQGDLKKANENFEKSYSIYKETGNKKGVAFTLHNIGLNYSIEGNNDQALEYYKESLKIMEEEGDQVSIAANLNDIGTIYFRLKNYNLAKDFCTKSLDLATKLGIPERISYASDLLSKIYSQEGNYKQAYKMQVLFKQMADSINNVEIKKETVRKQMQYEYTTQQALQKAEQNKKDSLAKAELQKQKVQKYSFIGGAILFLLLALVLYNRYRLKQKSNKIITKSYEDLKKAQGHLVQSEKMASLGQLTAGVAHEINNPINFVSANIKPLRRNFDDIKQVLNKYELTIGTKQLAEQFKDVESFKKENDFSYTLEEVNTLIKGIEDGANRTTEIVKGLRNFSRLDEGEKKKVNINDGVESTLLLINNLLSKKNIELIKSYGSLPEIDCYPGQLNQVFMNILTNAVDAIGESGKITITTSKENNKIRITIRDSGRGMDQEIRKKIFDPFFTTKDVGKGTGLGLSISYGIIEKHNGKIEVTSEVGKGSEFTITLPV